MTPQLVTADFGLLHDRVEGVEELFALDGLDETRSAVEPLNASP
ncbi:hypothetical protein [Streptomyces sp. NPDC006446]